MDGEAIPGVGGDGGVAVADGAADDAVVDDAAAGGVADGGEPAPEPDAAADADAAAAGGEGGDKTEPDLSDIETDGRKIDAKTRAEIAELKKTNPGAAKKWAESYFRNQAMMKEFPEVKTPGEAIAKVREMKNTIESLGGEKGIADLQTEVQDYRNEIDQFSKGDPKLIAQLGEANPEGLALSGSNALAWLKANKAEVYRDTLAPHLNEMLEGQGLDTTLEQLLGLTKEGKGQEVFDLLKKVVKWRAGHKEKAKTLADGKTTKNPEAEKLAKDRQEFEQQKTELYERNIGAEVNKSNNAALSKVIEPFFKEMKFTDPVAKRKFVGLVQSDVWAAMKADKVFQRQAHAIKAKGDAAKTAAFVAAKFEELLPEHFRLNRNALYPNSGKAKPAVAAVAAPNGKKVAPINLAIGARPKADQVDWTKTTDAMYATGKAFLKDGKFIQGFKDAPPNRY